MGHSVAALIAALFVFGTIALVVMDHVRTLAKRKHEAIVKAELCIATKKDEETKTLERQLDSNLEEMETLKGLSGIQGVTGAEVRAALASAGSRRHIVSDSQVSRDFHAKAEEVMRLAKKAANG